MEVNNTISGCLNSNELEHKLQVGYFLTVQGWKLVSQTDLEISIALAKKDYQTAVGVKSATAFFYQTKEKDFYLKAEYESQGQNIFPTLRYVMKETTTVHEIESIVSQFVSEIDKAVSDSYAVRVMVS